jgi:5,10-methylenetetrahydrofolate reductase
MSRLSEVLAAGRFAVTAEIGPPKHADAGKVRELARLLAPCTDAQNLTDNQTAVVRLCSLAAAVHVREAGGEPVLQLTCRDRNRIALQSDLLGAASLGIENVLCLTGDHQKFGNHPQAKGVFDLDSVQLLAMARGMGEGRFLNGEEIKAPPRLFPGAAENPFAGPSAAFRAARLAKKARAGARFIQTQVVYDLAGFQAFMAAVRQLGNPVPVLAGVTPPKSARALKYMQGIPGFRVSEEALRRMEGASDPKEEGIRLAVELIRQLREVPGVAGVHIMAIGWEEAVPRIVEESGLMPRPEIQETDGIGGAA